ncbi:hypothetical protein [Xanthomonas axonopodis]
MTPEYSADADGEGSKTRVTTARKQCHIAREEWASERATRAVLRGNATTTATATRDRLAARSDRGFTAGSIHRTRWRNISWLLFANR